jgi:hypothetical protein
VDKRKLAERETTACWLEAQAEATETATSTSIKTEDPQSAVVALSGGKTRTQEPGISPSEPTRQASGLAGNRAAAEMQMNSPLQAASMHALLLLAVLAPASAHGAPDTLQSNLAAAGLEQPQILSGVLLMELGLPSVQDVRLLNMPEQLELSKSLREQGINLGSRSKLRRLSEEAVEPGEVTAPEETLQAKSGTSHREREGGQSERRWQLQSDETPSVRRAQDEPAKAESSRFSVETLAIAVTGLLGLASYILQAKLALDSQHAENMHDRYIAQNERDRETACMQLKKIRKQMDFCTEAVMRCFTYNRGSCRLINQLLPDLTAEMGLGFFTLPANNASVMPLMGWMTSSWLPQNPYFVLPHNDVERHDRWVEFFTLVGMPQLRELRELLLPNIGITEPLSHAQVCCLLP